jgi:dihydrofolate reductase
MTVGMIWAQTRARVIGRDNRLPWRIPEDSAHFRAVTDGHPVIMGRRTWESLPARFRPLPGRRNLVVSRQPRYRAAGAEVVGSLAEALERATATDPRVWLAGGEEIYAAGARGLASVAEVTEVDLDVTGDTFAPPLTGWTLASTGEWQTSTTGVRFRWLRYTRPGTAGTVSSGVRTTSGMSRLVLRW